MLKFYLVADVYRPWLNTRVHGRTDYINAVFLPVSALRSQISLVGVDKYTKKLTFLFSLLCRRVINIT